VLGQADYYPRFGFVLVKSEGIDCEFEAPNEFWMFLELWKGALVGRRDTVVFQPKFREGAQRDPF